VTSVGDRVSDLEIRLSSKIDPDDLLVVNRPSGRVVAVVSPRATPEQVSDLLQLAGLSRPDVGRCDLTA
jgi:hypothetical protein